MTVKTTVSFTDRHHQFASSKVEEGVFASVSSLVAAGIEQIMQDEQEREIALEAMKATIEERMATPLDQWVEMTGEDKLFAKVKSSLK